MYTKDMSGNLKGRLDFGYRGADGRVILHFALTLKSTNE
jgi:hypothetical protein